MEQSKYYIIIMDEKVTYDFDGSIDDCVEAIMEEYERHDVTMSDLIKFIEIKGLSIADVVKVHAKLFKENQ